MSGVIDGFLNTSALLKTFVPVTIFCEIDPFASDGSGVCIYLHIKVANTVSAEYCRC